MRDDERRRRYDEEPEDDFDDLFKDIEEDDISEFSEEDDDEEIEDIEARLQKLFGGEPMSELEERAARLNGRGRELEVRVTGVYERIEHGQPRALLVQLRDNYG
ncbi:MAG: hypothetical protein ACK4UU_08935, partial [Fimbriimonadales bacterium]